MRIRYRHLIPLTAIILMNISCGHTDQSKELIPSKDESHSATLPVNGVSQNLPTIMVIPSDELLRRLECLRTESESNGNRIVRDYDRALTTDKELKFIISGIEGTFAEKRFPLENLEQQLKQLTNEAASDEMDGIAKDAKTMLLATARPDIIIDLDYSAESDPNSRNLRLVTNYSLTALDAHTNKAIASVARTSESQTGTEQSASAAISADLPKAMPQFQDQIAHRFTDLLANGTEITLRLTTMDAVSIGFDAVRNSETLAEWVNGWLKKNCVNSTYKSVRNSDHEMRFTNVRIPTQMEDGRSFNAFDFTSKLRKALADEWGINARNATQSIGDGYLILQSISSSQGGGQ